MKSFKSNKESAVIIGGVILIILVGLVTVTRPHWKKENSASIQNEEGGAKKEFPRLSAKELQNKIKNKENIAIIDIRSADEFGSEHIIDSINIPLENLKDSKLNFDSGKAIAVLGSGIDDSDSGAAVISQKGFSSIFVLSGGLAAWKNNGGNVINWGDPASFVNQAKVSFISPEDAKKSIDEKKDLLFLDVRQASDFSPHIPGAINIPLDSLEKRREEIPIGREIVACGNTELEGFMAGVRLYDLNIYPVSVLRGGFAGWKEKNYPVEK